MSVASYQLIQDYLDQGDLARASTELALTGPGEPEAAEFYVLRANLAWLREDFTAALAHVERALAIDPNHERAYYLGATAAMYSGNDLLVCRYGLAALSRGYADYDVLDGLATSLNRMGLADFAICAEARAITLDRQATSGYFNLGRSMLEIGDLPRAQAAYRTCETAADPRLLWPLDCSPAARTRLEAAVSAWAFAAYQIGLDESDRDAPDRGRELLQFAYDKYRADELGFMAGLAGEGLCLATMNTRDKEAVAALAPLCEQAIEQHPERDWPTLFLAAARFTAGDAEAALEICRQLSGRDLRQDLEYSVENAFLAPAGFDDAVAADQIVENPLRFREERPLGFEFDVALDDRYPEVELQTEGVVFVACTADEFERHGKRFLASIDRFGKPALVHFHLIGATEASQELVDRCRARFESLALNVSSRPTGDLAASEIQALAAGERIWAAPAVLKFYGCTMLLLDVSVSVEADPEAYLKGIGQIDVGLISAAPPFTWLVESAECAVFGCSARGLLFLEVARRYIDFLNQNATVSGTKTLPRNILSVARAACREFEIGVEFRNLNDQPAIWSRIDDGVDETPEPSPSESITAEEEANIGAA
jgi:tetratricopeptide (TPR) repeat protein